MNEYTVVLVDLKNKRFSADLGEVTLHASSDKKYGETAMELYDSIQSAILDLEEVHHG